MKVKYEGGQVLTDVMPDLKKTRFSFGAVLFFIFCATSGGAFGIESIIPASGPGMTLVLLVIIPLMWALPMGLYVSELTNLAPVDSGPYVWVKMAFGEFWGFAFGLWMAVAWYLTGASYIVLATDYIGMYINMSPMVELAVKVVIILVFTVVNLLGLQEVNVVNTIFTFIILAAFLAVAIVGLANWENNPFDPFMNVEEGAFSSLGVGIAIGVWMFCGYTAIANLGGEIENPQIIPKGMKWCIVLMMVAYILPTLGGIVSTGTLVRMGIFDRLFDCIVYSRREMGRGRLHDHGCDIAAGPTQCDDGNGVKVVHDPRQRPSVPEVPVYRFKEPQGAYLAYRHPCCTQCDTGKSGLRDTGDHPVAAALRMLCGICRGVPEAEKALSCGKERRPVLCKGKVLAVLHRDIHDDNRYRRHIDERNGIFPAGVRADTVRASDVYHMQEGIWRSFGRKSAALSCQS